MADREPNPKPRNSEYVKNAPETFKREGPPPQGDTGRDIDEMNEKAEESVIRNVEPDQQVD